jgi:hypothetical protein
MKAIFLTSLFLCLTVCAAAQAPVLVAKGNVVDTLSPIAFLFGDGSTMFATSGPAADRTAAVLVAPVSLPRMSPELALQAYQGRSALQAATLVSYSAITRVSAQLPETSQHGEFELERHYSAPHTLEFKAVSFTGDGFVKSNIITRLLQSEVDHVQKDDTSLTAMSPANYKFSFKGTTQLDGRTVHVYQLKPRKKRVGLFKGRIYLDVYTGSLVRVEGSVVKSPSFFIKKIEFAQDYSDFGAFTLPTYIHSEAKTRLVGRAIVDIYHSDYQPVGNTTLATQIPAF